MNEEWSQVAANAIAHEARMAGAAIQQAAAQYERPSAIYRPALSIDGDLWCVLYGENLQDGVAGFGKSPAAAMYDFDVAWGREMGTPPADNKENGKPRRKLKPMPVGWTRDALRRAGFKEDDYE